MAHFEEREYLIYLIYDIKVEAVFVFLVTNFNL